MQATFEHPKYGTVLYDENAWTGAKRLYVNGRLLEKQSKNTFVLVKDKQTVYFTLKGSFISGVKLIVDDRIFPIVTGPKWYEILLVVAIAIFYFVWASIPALFQYLPVVGGAIGGAVCGGFSFLSLYLMKMQKNPGIKILIGLGMGVAIFAVTYLLAATLLSAMA
ncbi:MAG: hypothetical protein J6M34_04765 [Clostridia bacterium]|nr:hypothetical protein [Clostridia bacterium]